MQDATGSQCIRMQTGTSWHQALNDIVSQAFSSARIPTMKKSPGFTRTDGKCPSSGWLFSYPMAQWEPIAWDVTVATTLAESYTVH